ncbi:hypothetical protein EH228_04680 [Erwinia endophytica]|uniref:hypothetical protein n=1 Tax=Erwinia endophytica TaxID=1563158 RepID=UPI001265EF0A|nr:hypothetical protein [Erwinia endophytica]KAB8312975.1 hypothetical protein EH228_04680 [Erwinia endophytica]
MSVEWDGHGLPPVGCECEALNGLAWYPCIIVAHYDGFAFAWNYDRRITFTINAIKAHENFRPIRTKAERNREDFLKYCHEKPVSTFSELYADIAAGKIPGIRLTDE